MPVAVLNYVRSPQVTGTSRTDIISDLTSFNPCAAQNVRYNFYDLALMHADSSLK